MRRYAWRWVGAFMALSASSVVCSAAPDVVKIGMAVANNSNYAPVYAAQELGYYKDQNIDAQVTEFRGGAAAQQAMSVGAADMITYYGGGVALAVLKGANEKMVATIDAKPYSWHLIVNSSSAYHSVKDLAGKKIGISTKASTTDVLAQWAAKRVGVTFQTIPVGQSGEVSLLLSGQVDAIVIPPLQSLQLLANGTGRSVLDYGKEMEPNLPDVWVASGDMMAKRPEVLRRTLTAIYKALGYMKANPDWTVSFLKKFTKEDDERVLKLAYQESTTVQSPDGVIERAWVQNALELGAQNGMKELVGVKPEDVYTTEFTPVNVNK